MNKNAFTAVWIQESERIWEEEKIKLMAKLKKYKISLTQYESALKQKGLE